MITRMGMVARVVGMIAGVLLLAASMTAGLQRLGVLGRPSSLDVALAGWRPGCIPGQVVPATDGDQDEEPRLLRLRLATPVPVEWRQQPPGAPVVATVCIRADGRVRDVEVLSGPLRSDQILIFEGKVRAWRFQPGPARCYRDRFRVTSSR
jgi:hypothetical protein